MAKTRAELLTSLLGVKALSSHLENELLEIVRDLNSLGEGIRSPEEWEEIGRLSAQSNHHLSARGQNSPRSGNSRSDLDNHRRIRTVFVERLELGRLFPPTKTNVSRLQSDRSKARYDVVVDELSGTILIQNGTKSGHQPILSVSAMQRGMLWLVLVHAGHRIEHSDISKVFGTKSLNTRYQYPFHLGILLGERLRNKVIGKGLNRQYPVSKKGWSFLWIRKSESPTESDLLHRLAPPPKKD